MPAPGPGIVAARAAAATEEAARALDALKCHRGNHRAAAAELGVSVDTLRRRVAAAGLSAEDLRAYYPLGGRQPRGRKENRHKPSKTSGQ